MSEVYNLRWGGNGVFCETRCVKSSSIVSCSPNAALYRTETNPAAPRGSQLHQEMVSDFVKRALQRDKELKAAVAADAEADVFQMFRARSDADLAAAGLKRVPTGRPIGSTDGAAGGGGAGERRG